MAASTEIVVHLQMTDYVEVIEAGMKRANKLLARGYKLLTCDFVAFEANRREPAPGGGKTFIRHDAKYVIGRTEEQPRFPTFAELDTEPDPN